MIRFLIQFKILKSFKLQFISEFPIFETIFVMENEIVQEEPI